MPLHNPTPGVSRNMWIASTIPHLLSVPKILEFRLYPWVVAYFYVADKYKFQVVFHTSRNTHSLPVILELYIVPGFTFTFRGIFWKCSWILFRAYFPILFIRVYFFFICKKTRIFMYSFNISQLLLVCENQQLLLVCEFAHWCA